MGFWSEWFDAKILRMEPEPEPVLQIWPPELVQKWELDQEVGTGKMPAA